MRKFLKSHSNFIVITLRFPPFSSVHWHDDPDDADDDPELSPPAFGSRSVVPGERLTMSDI